jgi:aspartate kinase
MKPLLVMKFGGTSLADKAAMERAAERITARAARYRLVAAVSAMGKETDRLVALTHRDRGAEYDVLLSSGEQVSAALLAQTLQKQGLAARSFMGWQVPILTDSHHARARIEKIETQNITASLAQGEVAVVAGFQGIGPDGRITTLGRGGSDTSAVALAVALKAELCEIYTDVEGVFTTDPQIVDEARCLTSLSYEEMVELSSLGARVLQTRSVALAKLYAMPVRVLPAASEAQGTLICSEKEMEQQDISGIAYSKGEAKITLSALSDKPGIAARIFAPLSRAGVLVDMIAQSSSLDSKSTDITFTIEEENLSRALTILEEEKENIGYKKIAGDSQVAKVSVVGLGMRTQSGIADIMFGALSKEGVNIQAISTSEIKISVLVEEAQMEKAVKVLHAAYGLADK